MNFSPKEINYSVVWGGLKSRLDSHFLSSQSAIEEHKCAICLHLLHDPMQLPSCGHVFCKECISKVSPQRCPFCNEPYDQIFADKKTENYLLNMKAQCPNNPDHFQGSIRELIRHLNADCEDEPYTCSCSAKVVRKEKTDHDNSKCPHRMVLCDLCTEKTQFSQLNTHKKKTCPFDICKFCKAKKKRGPNDDHTDKCPERPSTCFVPHCQKQLPRKALEEHINSSLLDHFEGMSKQMLSMQQLIQTMNQQMLSMQMEIGSLKRTMKLQNDFYFGGSKLWLVCWSAAMVYLPDLDNFTAEIADEVQYTARFTMIFDWIDDEVHGEYQKKILKNNTVRNHQGTVHGNIDWSDGRVVFDEDGGGYVWDMWFDGNERMIGTWEKGPKKGVVFMRRLKSGMSEVPGCYDFKDSALVNL